MGRARISTFTPKVGAEILRRIANGESLNRICGPDRKKGLPERMTVYNWINRHPSFKAAYLMARLAQADLYAGEVIEISDGRDPEALEPRDVRRDRLRVETRRWLAAVLAPHLYAEKLALRGAAPEDEAQRQEDEHARDARIAAIMERARRRAENDAS